MKVLTNFSIEFTELYEVVSSIISKGSRKKATLSPMTAFLITLRHLKHNEDWRKIAVSFDINYSYAYKKMKEIISICHETLSERFIKLIGVSQRIQQYNQRYLDWPALLGSVDATVQSISRPHDNQDMYYSGKHKAHVIKVQAFVSPV